MTKCRLCDGSGRILLMNSWFIADGLRSERCPACVGRGSFPAFIDPDWTKRQAQLRARCDESTISKGGA